MRFPGQQSRLLTAAGAGGGRRRAPAGPAACARLASRHGSALGSVQWPRAGIISWPATLLITVERIGRRLARPELSRAVPG